MIKFVKKAVFIILSLSMMVSLGSCGNQSGERDENEIVPGWQLHGDEEVGLEWYINFSWFSTTYGENMVSKKITEETGANISFTVPTGSESQKLDSLISSDMLPDIITLGWWEPQVNTLIEGGYVYSLDELAAEYDPYFYEVASEAKLNWYRSDDGNTYCYPNSSYTLEDYENNKGYISSNQTFLVRKDIYEAIGSPDMTTPEGFADAVRKAAQMFPEVNGEPIIPIGVREFDEVGCDSFGTYLQNLLAIPFEENGEAYDRTTDPEYIMWLKVFRELNSEGYLASDIFIDKRTQMEEKIAEGRYFCMIYPRSDMVDQQNILYSIDPDSIYIAVDGPRNSNGSNPTLAANGIYGWTVTFISKNCEHPDRAIQLLSYLISEHGQKMVYLGIEGEMYEMVDGKAVINDEVFAVLNSDRAAYDRVYGADDTYWMLQDNAMQARWAPQTGEQNQQLFDWAAQYTCYTGQYDAYFATDSEEGKIDTDIKHIWGEVLPKLLTADSDAQFDRIFADFLDQRDKCGFEQLLAARTEQMIEAKEKLGIS